MYNTFIEYKYSNTISEDNIMKKILAMLLALVMIFSLAACSKKEEAPAATPTAAATTAAKEETTANNTEAADISINTDELESLVTDTLDDIFGGLDVETETETAAPTSGKKKAELVISSAAELKSVENDILVAKYTGTAEQLVNEDDAYINDYGTTDIYLTWKGFNEDGSLDQIFGYLCLYYFYPDKESYEAGLAKVGSDLRGQNDECLYFTAITSMIDGDTWEECADYYRNGGDFRHPHFELVE